MNIIVWSGLGVKRISRFDPPAKMMRRGWAPGNASTILILDKNDRKWQSECEVTIILIVLEISSKFRNGDIAWQMGDM